MSYQINVSDNFRLRLVQGNSEARNKAYEKLYVEVSTGAANAAINQEFWQSPELYPGAGQNGGVV